MFQIPAYQVTVQARQLAIALNQNKEKLRRFVTIYCVTQWLIFCFDMEQISADAPNRN